MIIQILRTVLIGAIIYFLSKTIKGMIDRKLAPPKNDKPDSTATDHVNLTPCPECGVYIPDGENHNC